MGHYESSYEHDAKEQDKAKRKMAKRSLGDLQAFRANMPEAPRRILDAIEEIEDWLIVQQRR
jgi:hypothetical protein